MQIFITFILNFDNKDKNTEITISTLAVKLAGNMVEKENLDTADILYLYVLAIFSMINQK
jgi:hypothetical protein